ncbi:hypothetical protein ACP70R_037334 [Stipagrostis hirtigluma subsp. patula]
MLQNVSLRYLPVSFNQAIGATMLFFTAVLAYAVAARTVACTTYAALLPIVAGVVIATGGEPSFHLFGFITCVGATAGRALKTVLQGNLLSSEQSAPLVAQSLGLPTKLSPYAGMASNSGTGPVNRLLDRFRKLNFSSARLAGKALENSVTAGCPAPQESRRRACSRRSRPC